MQLDFRVKNCQNCKGYNGCPYRTNFNMDENLGCIYWIDMNTPDTTISNRIEESDIVESTLDNRCR